MPKTAMQRLVLLRLEMGRVTREIREELRRLKATHTNPNMTMLGPNCGVISSRHLGKSLSAEYHIFSGQYTALLKFLGTNPVVFCKRLSEAIRQGCIRPSGTPRHYQSIHPDVLAQLKRIRSG